MRFIKDNFRKLLFILPFFLIANTSFVPDEGMYPLSEIHKLDLQKAGLKIDPKLVYNPDGVSLIDALVQLTGCTGSFVSNDGLIITNHHCSFGAIQQASTLEQNYLENGFVAKTKEEEIPAAGITCRITTSYEDVSKEVLAFANKETDITKRGRAIANIIKEIVKREETKDTTIDAEVSEMFIGQSYILFRYKVIKDVRLVCAPPRNIGEFGGESDNWVWPRHTGDFSFLRAYVAPDGSPAPYSKKNVPFHPKKFLKVNANGVNENDFVFVLGYPGRTFKNQPSQFIKYQEDFQLPYVQQSYDWMINLYLNRGKNDPEYALNIAGKIKSLANTEKNYRGKLKGLYRLGLVSKKEAEEMELQKFIDANSDLKKEYGSVLTDIDNVYKSVLSTGRVPFFFSLISRNVSLYRLAEILVEYNEERVKPENERKALYTTANKSNLTKTISGLFETIFEDVDKETFIKFLWDASTMKEFIDNPVKYADKKDVITTVNDLYKNTLLLNQKEYEKLLQLTPEEFKKASDPVLDLVRKYETVDRVYQTITSGNEGKLNVLLAKFLEVKKQWLKKNFIPDANSTLRLTYGYIKGYSPADATKYSPFTTLTGLMEKGSPEGDYRLNEMLKKLYASKDYGRFKDKNLNDIPVAMIYNTDTSGGNSGSPVLNAYGELIGVNFDRTFEATINDYAWSEYYSRSIAVDIRYVLWVTEKVSGASHLLKEMGV